MAPALVGAVSRTALAWGRVAADLAAVLLEEQTELEPVARLVVGQHGLLGAPGEQLRQIAPALAAHVQSRERVQRVGIGVVEIVRRAQRHDGRVGIAELLVLEAGDGLQRHHALGRLVPVLERAAVEGHLARAERSSRSSRLSMAPNDATSSSGAKS